MTTLTIFAAWFAFGYSVTDIVQGYLADRRINQFIQDLDNKNDE
jgi:hypothetical protein